VTIVDLCQLARDQLMVRSRPMACNTDHPPGTPASANGHYRLVNVFSSPTEYSAHGRRSVPLPHAPRRQGWRLERETADDA
jgi:hypothetical protein